ncbi:hypothetical protein FA13DRAFT_1569470, partial [Coprinellus micaceus]
YTALTILILQEDIQRFFKDKVNENVIRAQACAYKYAENHCATQYTPAMREQCTTWNVCMKRDPSAISRAALVGAY